MSIAWDETHRTSMDDCNDDRCPINKFVGQCHLRRGHVGVCDPHGLSHWESSVELKGREVNEFIGAYFHGDVKHPWQGQVLGPVSESGNYWYVQTFSWLDNSNSTRHVVSIHTLSDWTFYPGPASMKANANSARQRWKQPAALEGEIHEFFQDMLNLNEEKQLTGEQIYQAWVEWKRPRQQQLGG
jgi:hypothetical protein